VVDEDDATTTGDDNKDSLPASSLATRSLLILILNVGATTRGQEPAVTTEFQNRVELVD